MATYRIIEKKFVSKSETVPAQLRYYVQRRRPLFGWVDETYVDSPSGELGITRKHWFDTFEEARKRIIPNDLVETETIIVQYLNV